jgi:hypothetical protein
VVRNNSEVACYLWQRGTLLLAKWCSLICGSTDSWKFVQATAATARLPSNESIVSVTPGDFDYDGKLDLLVRTLLVLQEG